METAPRRHTAIQPLKKNHRTKNRRTRWARPAMRSNALTITVCLLCAVTSPGWAQQEFQWQAATPESQGMSSAKLKALEESLAARKTAALLVIRNDKIVHEWYSPTHSATKTHSTASLAKAIVGGVTCAVA